MWKIKSLGRMATFTEDQGLFRDITSHCEFPILRLYDRLHCVFNSSDFYIQSLSKVVRVIPNHKIYNMDILRVFLQSVLWSFQHPIWHLNTFKEALISTDEISKSMFFLQPFETIFRLKSCSPVHYLITQKDFASPSHFVSE